MTGGMEREPWRHRPKHFDFTLQTSNFSPKCVDFIISFTTLCINGSSIFFCSFWHVSLLNVSFFTAPYDVKKSLHAQNGKKKLKKVVLVSFLIFLKWNEDSWFNRKSFSSWKQKEIKCLESTVAASEMLGCRGRRRGTVHVTVKEAWFVKHFSLLLNQQKSQTALKAKSLILLLMKFLGEDRDVWL